MAQNFPSDPNTDPGIGGISTVGSNTYMWTGESWVGHSDSSGGSNQSLQQVLDVGNTANIGLSVVGVITANSFVVGGGTSEQFLKADGSLDSLNYSPSNLLSLQSLPE